MKNNRKTLPVGLAALLALLSPTLLPSVNLRAAAVEPAPGLGQKPMFVVSSLSSSGARLTVASTSSSGSGPGTLRVYELTEGKGLELGRPALTYEVNFEILDINWGEDESRLVVTTAVSTGADASTRSADDVKLLDLKTGRWTSLTKQDTSSEAKANAVLRTDHLPK